MRLKHQQPSGFSVSVSASRTFAVSRAALFEAFVDPRLRERWLSDGVTTLRASQEEKAARFDWGDGSTRVSVWFVAKGEQKPSVTVAHERLPDLERAERSLLQRLAEAPSLPEEARGLLALPSQSVWAHYGDLAVVGDKVWFSLQVSERHQIENFLSGLVRCARDGGDPEVLTVTRRDEWCADFEVVGDSATLDAEVRRDCRIVERQVRSIGPLASFLQRGWRPAPVSDRPSFGFHAPLSTVEG